MNSYIIVMRLGSYRFYMTVNAQYSEYRRDAHRFTDRKIADECAAKNLLIFFERGDVHIEEAE